MGFKLSLAVTAIVGALFVFGCEKEDSSKTSTPAPPKQSTSDVKDSIDKQADAAKAEADKQVEAAEKKAEEVKKEADATADAAKKALDEVSNTGKKLMADIQSAIDSKDFSKLGDYIKQAEALKDQLPPELKAQLDALITKAKELMPKMP